MSTSRTKSVSKNMIVALTCQTINTVISFVARTVFIKILGSDYLGLNGLFTNILTILSFAELGIGNAIVFSMYKPLAVGDCRKIASLMALYKKAYETIGLVVAIVGGSVTPFIRFIIKDPPDISENIYVLYLLFLFNTVCSYFFVYKRSIIIADQKNYIVLALTEGTYVIQIVSQIIFLYLTHNYMGYLLLQIGGTLLGNIITSVASNKMYPFLKDKAEPLGKEEVSGIFRNVRALTLYKFGSVILNGTDNILVSSLIGVTEVGLVSNYILLSTTCTTVLNKITDAFTASVGNLNAISDSKKKYEIFNKLFLITAWLYGLASVGLIMVSESFVCAWIGREFLVDKITVIAIVAGFYVKGVHFVAYTYRTTLGLFVEGRMSPLAAAILNIVLSFVLCKWIGLAGIFIATPIARVLTTGVIDPVLIYKKHFHLNPMIYYVKYAGYVLIFTAISIVCGKAISLVTITGWLGVIVQAVIVTVIFNLIMLLIFGRTKMFKEIVDSILSLIPIKRKKRVS